MRDPERRRRAMLVNTITIILAVGITVYLIWALKELILPFVLGILLAYLFRPLRSAFKYRWLPNGIRVVFLFTLLTSGILIGIKFIKNNIPNDKEKLEILVRLKYKFNEKFNSMMGFDQATGKGNAMFNLISQDLSPLKNSINGYLELSPDQQEAFLEFRDGVEGFEPVSEKYYQYFLINTKKVEQPKREPAKTAVVAATIPNTAKEKSVLKTAMGILSIWFLLPIVFVFFLLDDGIIGQFFIRLVPNRYFELVLTVKDEVDQAIGKYLRGISMECGLVFISMTAGLYVVGIGLKMAILIGILAGLATAIPFLGPVVGLSFGLTHALIVEEINPLLPFVSMDNLPVAVFFAIGIVLALDNIVFQPIVLGGAVNLHPLIVIIGIMAASMMFGMAGVLLAIPSIVIIKVIIQHTFGGLKDYRII